MKKITLLLLIPALLSIFGCPGELLREPENPAEVNQYKTDPIVADSDGDGLEESACTLQLEYGLAVTIQDEEGNPISGATVTATEGDYSEVLEEHEKGRYFGAAEREGSYSITAEMSGYQSGSTTATVTGSKCHVSPQSVTIVLTSQGESLHEPENSEESVCTLQLEYGLAVTIQDEEGNPISGATVTATEGDYSEVLEEHEKGRYFGAAEREGSYSITAEMSGYQSGSTTATVTGSRCHVFPQSVTIVLTPPLTPL